MKQDAIRHHSFWDALVSGSLTLLLLLGRSQLSHVATLGTVSCQSFGGGGEELVAPLVILYLSSAEVSISEVNSKRNAPRGVFGCGWKRIIN